MKVKLGKSLKAVVAVYWDKVFDYCHLSRMECSRQLSMISTHPVPDLGLSLQSNCIPWETVSAVTVC
jgi:hypothetical protein